MNEGRTKMKRETGFFREHWIYFKRGKNEINFLMNVYQTLILLLGISYVAELPLTLLIALTLGFGWFFFIIAIIIGKYTTQKVDTSAYYISPYFIDQNFYRDALLNGLTALAQGNNKEAIRWFDIATFTISKWLVDENEDK